jgi:hypothetical protein
MERPEKESLLIHEVVVMMIKVNTIFGQEISDRKRKKNEDDEIQIRKTPNKTVINSLTYTTTTSYSRLSFRLV